MPDMKITRDHALRAKLAGVDVRPILIMGLHRSGTTWLYEALASVLPVATLSVYDIVHYGELLAAHEDGTAPSRRRAIDARLGGAKTRGFDDIALSHATLDEYGFVLLRHAGRAVVDARTLPTFDELTRKLALLAGRPDVLLKNPWDSRQGAFLAQHVPRAKFIFLRRNPVRILDSQMRMLDGFLAGENPLLELLFEGQEPEGTIFEAVRTARRLAGVERFRRLFTRVIEKHVRDEIGRLRASFAAVPPARRIELDYDELIVDPAAGLEPAVRFLELAPTRPLTTVKATPRGRDLLPAVAARAESLRAALTL
jgi:hypothetical protein